MQLLLTTSTFTVSYHGLMSMTVMLSEGMHAFVAARTSGAEWDLAPHAAILESVGGLVTDFKGHPQTYNTPDPPHSRRRCRGRLAPRPTLAPSRSFRAARLKPIRDD